MKRLAVLGFAALAVGCAPDRQPPAAPESAVLSAAKPANSGDPNDDFHSLPHADGEEGSHFRLGHISWRKTGALTAEFTYVVGFRRSYYGSPVVGQSMTLANISFSGGQGSLTPTFTVTFVDATNDWFEARAVFTKTFTGPGPFEMTSTGCCRIGISSTPGWAHMNNADRRVRYWGTINLNHQGSAASTLPPMVTCAIGGVCTFFVTATAPSGLTVRWRLATPTEMGDASSKQPGPPQAPNAATVNPSTGLYTWNAAGAAIYTGTPARKSVYSTQVVMEGLDANNVVVTRSMIDFLILLANVQLNAPPAFQAPTPADGSSYTINPGQTLNLSLSATDPNAADVVSISGLGMPAGSSLTSSPGNPANSGFTFSATNAHAGQSFAVSFIPTDNHGLSGSQRSIIINVPANQPPTAVIAGPATVGEGSGVDLSAAGSSDPDGDPLHYSWLLDGTPTGGDSPSLHIQVGDGPATHIVSLTVTDGKGGQSTVLHTYTVSNLPPYGTLNAQSPVNEGQSFTLTFSAVDDPSPADIAAIVNAAFDCGDGAGYGPFSTVLHAVCPTTDNGTRNVRGQLRDKDGGTAEYATVVIVNNVAPTVQVAPAGVIYSGATYNLSGAFQDVGVNDQLWSYLVNWGGPTSGGTTAVQGAVSASRQYLVAGTYPITLSVTDKDGGTGSAMTTLVVQRLPISCDVKPETINLNGDANNTGNGKGGGAPSGMVILHCFSTATVDVTTLQVTTGTLGDNAGVETPVARRNNGTYYLSVDDVNADGRPDIILHFNRADMIANGDLVSGMPRLYFRGTLGDGRQVLGSDAVRVIP